MEIVRSAAKDLEISDLDSAIDVIDFSAAKDHVIASVQRSNIEPEPFPYVILKNVFDSKTYDALLGLVALDGLFYTEEGGTGYTILRYPQTNYDLSTNICAFVEFLADDLTPALLDALRRKFSDCLFNWAEELRRRGLYIKPTEAMLTTEIRTEHHPYEALHDGMSAQFEIMRRTQEFVIPPHCHPVRELLIGLFPIVADDSLGDYGTELFAMKSGGSPDIDLTEFSYIAPDLLEPAGRTRFLRNSAFVMLNTAGVHAYKPPPQPRPRNYLYTTLMIGAYALGQR